MSMQEIQIIQQKGEVFLVDLEGNTKKFQGDFSLNDTLNTSAGSSITIFIKGLGEIILGENQTFFLDESLLSQEALSMPTSFAVDSLKNYFNDLTTDIKLLDQNEHLDFSSLHVNTQETSESYTMDIRDLIDLPQIETKIFHNEAHTVELNHSDWIKHDGIVFEDGFQFELYSKHGINDTVFTLLIEDTISVVDTQG